MTPGLWAGLRAWGKDSLWLERDDETAAIVRDRWKARAMLEQSRRHSSLAALSHQQLQRLLRDIFAEPVAVHPLCHPVERWIAKDDEQMLKVLIGSRIVEEPQ